MHGHPRWPQGKKYRACIWDIWEEQEGCKWSWLTCFEITTTRVETLKFKIFPKYWFTILSYLFSFSNKYNSIISCSLSPSPRANPFLEVSVFCRVLFLLTTRKTPVTTAAPVRTITRTTSPITRPWLSADLSRLSWMNCSTHLSSIVSGPGHLSTLRWNSFTSNLSPRTSSEWDRSCRIFLSPIL